MSAAEWARIKAANKHHVPGGRHKLEYSANKLSLNGAVLSGIRADLCGIKINERAREYAESASAKCERTKDMMVLRSCSEVGESVVGCACEACRGPAPGSDRMEPASTRLMRSL